MYATPLRDTLFSMLLDLRKHGRKGSLVSVDRLGHMALFPEPEILAEGEARKLFGLPVVLDDRIPPNTIYLASAPADEHSV